MAIQFEQPRVSLIQSGSLPTARANINVPNIGGQLASIGEKLTARAQAKQGENEFVDGQTAAGEFIAMDADGSFKAWPERTFTDEQARNAYDTALAQNYTTQFESALSVQLAEIQGDATATPDQKRMRMDAALDARLAAVGKAAPRLVASLRARGTEVIGQRHAGMILSDQERQAQLTVDGLKFGIENDLAQGSAAAATGVVTSKFTDSINEKYDTLVGMRRMSPEAAANGKRLAAETITSSGVSQRLSTFLYNGDLTPQQIDDFASAIETGNAVDLTVDFEPDDFGRQRPGVLFSSKQFREVVQNPTLRNQLAADLRQASAERSALLASGAKWAEFSSNMESLNSNPAYRHSALESAHRDDFNKLASSVMVNDKPFETQAGFNKLAKLIVTARVMPQSVVDSMRSMINSGDKAQLEQAVATWQMLRTARNGYGDNVGAALLNSMKEEDVNVLSAVTDAYDDGFTLEELQTAISELNGRQNKVSFSDRVAIYNGSKDEGNFYRDMHQALAKQLGDNVPPEAVESFKSAFNVNMVLTGSPEKAFARSLEMVAPRYLVSDIFYSGYGKADTSGLANPTGYEARQRTFFGNAPGTEFEWLGDFISNEINALTSGAEGQPKIAFANPDEVANGLTPETLAAAFQTQTETTPAGTVMGMGSTAPTRKGFLGKSVFLRPTNTALKNPQFEVWVDTGNGARVRVDVTGRDGQPRPLLIDPYTANAQATAKLKQEADRKILEEAAGGAETGVRLNTLQDAGMTGSRGVQYYLKPENFDEWLKTQPEEVQQKHQGRVDTLYQSIEKQMRRVNGVDPDAPATSPASETPAPDQQGAVETPAQPVSQATLLAPRQSGYDIAQAAVNAVDSVLPDGTGGVFMMRVAAQESNFGQAPGSFRLSGDKGIWQTSTTAGFVEVKRRIQTGQGAVFQGAEKIKGELGIDVASLTEADLDKPLVAAAVARLYFMAFSAPIPPDVEGQAAYWKRYYNTSLGAGTPEQFVANASKVRGGVVIEPAGVDLTAQPVDGAPPKKRDIISYAKGEMSDPIIVSSTTGKRDPANFLALDPTVQKKAKELAAAFGEPLRITPIGGRQPDKRSKGSQHKVGAATDYLIADMPDDKKTRLVATAIANGANGIGAYGGTSQGAGTIHFDYRAKGDGPGGLALWWRTRPNQDLPYTSGPQWFQEGIRLGLELRKNKQTKVAGN
jgi:hypothetical protein